MSGKLFGNDEIIRIANSVSHERSIPVDEVLEAIEEAVRVVARRKYGNEHFIRAEVHRGTGAIDLYREMIVVENEDSEISEEIAEQYPNINKITLENAKVKNENAELGDILSEPLPPIDLGRVGAKTAKQVMANKIREIERAKQYEQFKGKIGEIVNGVVEKMDRGNAIIKVGSAEITIARSHLMKNDRFKQGDRISAYLVDVDPENKGSQILLSRTHGNFLARLFAHEVPEVYDNIIEIKAVSRDPGFRAKIAVYSADTSIDPVGSCVGIRGSRVQAVMNELNGERIDIINWSSDQAALVVNALAPAEATKVIMDEEKEKVEVVVPAEQLSIAVGKGGQNIKLASGIVGWKIEVMTEEEESIRRTQEFNAMTNRFMEALDLEEILAQLLVSEGYNSIQILADAEVEALASVEGLDEGIAQELITRAQSYAQTHVDAEVEAEELASMKIDEKFLGLKNMTQELAEQLHHCGIKEIIDVADLARDDFLDVLPNSGLSNKQIDEMIMSARAIAF